MLYSYYHIHIRNLELLWVMVLELLLCVEAPKESSISEVFPSFSAGSLLRCNRIGGLSGREQRETDKGDEQGDAAETSEV